MNDTKWTLTQFIDEWITGDDTLTCGLLEDAYRIVDQHYEEGVDYCCNLMTDQIFSDLTVYDKTGLIADILQKFVNLRSIAEFYIDSGLKAKGLDSPFFF